MGTRKLGVGISSGRDKILCPTFSLLSSFSCYCFMNARERDVRFVGGDIIIFWDLSLFSLWNGLILFN